MSQSLGSPCKSKSCRVISSSRTDMGIIYSALLAPPAYYDDLRIRSGDQQIATIFTLQESFYNATVGVGDFG